MSLSKSVQFGHLYRKLYNRNWRNSMRKGRIKSPCVSLECIIRIEFCGGKTRFSHAIAANKRANSHNFKTKNLNLLTITFLADYLMNRGKSSYMNNRLWKWIILSVRSLTVFEENIAVTVLAKLASLFFKNVHALFLFLRSRPRIA